MRRIANDYDRLAKLTEEQLADQERGAMATKLRTDCSLVAATVRKRFHPRLDRDASNTPALPFSRVPSPLSGQNHSWGRT